MSKVMDFSYMNNTALTLVNRSIAAVVDFDKVALDLKKAITDAKNDGLTDDEKREADKKVADLKVKKREANKVVKAFANRVRISTQADRDILEGVDLVSDFSVDTFIQSVGAYRDTDDGDESFTEKSVEKMQSFVNVITDRGHYTYKTGSWTIEYKEIKNRDDEFIKALAEALRATKAFKDEDWTTNTRLVKKFDGTLETIA